MSAKQIAEIFDLTEYGFGESFENSLAANRQVMKDNGIVVVYGASDDLMEVDGFMREEFDGEGRVFFKSGKIIGFSKEGYGYKVINEKDCDAPSISGYFCHRDYNPDGWGYDVSFPHETFEILEDGEVFCCGVVFNISDIQ